MIVDKLLKYVNFVAFFLVCALCIYYRFLLCKKWYQSVCNRRIFLESTLEYTFMMGFKKPKVVLKSCLRMEQRWGSNDQDLSLANIKNQKNPIRQIDRIQREKNSTMREGFEILRARLDVSIFPCVNNFSEFCSHEKEA